MAKKKKIPEKYQRWIDARKRYHLSHTHIQMARDKQEPWKLSLPEFIVELYFKHFKKRLPDNVRSIEQMVNDYNRKKEEHRARRLKEKES